ncbi:MAG: 2-hydroxyacyl-CoA dehydratase family protein [Oscillospiraceae bacterium]
MATAERKKGLGNLYSAKHRAMRHREWRGFKDTIYDYFRWLKLLGLLGGKLFPVLPQMAKALFRYRWIVSYLTTPAFVDRHTIGLRDYDLRYTHEQFYALLQNSVAMVKDILERDENLNPKSKKAAALREKTIIFDEMMPIQVMAGFPTLKGIPLQMIPIFEAGEVDQQANMYYIDAIEHFGLAPDVCPLPAAECGCAVVDDYPKIGKLYVSSIMPCDGSVVSCMYTERYFKELDCYQITPPQRFNEEEVQEYAVKNIKGCIKFIEDRMNVKFDWDAYFSVMKRHNTETQYMMDKWDINCTDYPQICGAGLALHREYEFQIASSLDDYFVKADEKVNKLMMKGYEHAKKVGDKPLYRAIVWSCPAHYYSNFTYWAQNCWGIKTLVDMECMLTHHFYDLEDKEKSLVDMAKGYERMTMRSHSNGGYVNALDECWKMCEKFNANIVFMYNHVSCKNFAGLQGLFEDQARDHGINLIWVEHDLMDPRTVSRKAMRDRVNRYMTTVFRAQPLDPSLVDYDDDITW